MPPLATMPADILPIFHADERRRFWQRACRYLRDAIMMLLRARASRCPPTRRAATPDDARMRYAATPPAAATTDAAFHHLTRSAACVDAADAHAADFRARTAAISPPATP